MADEVTLPPLPSPSAGPDELREALRALILWAQAREPLADGNGLDKFLTGSAALSSGLLSYSPGAGVSAGSGGAFLPGPATSNPADASPPTPISGLTVAEGVAHNLIQWSSPTYTQGGGNGRTIIYAANYSGAGPLPTFENAVEVGTTPGRGVILVVDAEPGVQVHYWAKAETRHPTLQASPTGGTNGVTATADLIEDQHIVNLSVAKLIAGAIGVSEYIESTGYTPGSAGWRINGDGTAEFSGVVVRGTVYATGGSFSGTLSVGTSPAVSGATMTGTGAVFNADGTYAIGNSARNLSFNGTTLTMNGPVVTGDNIDDPPFVASLASSGGEIELIEPATGTTTAELRTVKAGDGMNISVAGGVVTFTSKSSDDNAIRLALDVSTSNTTPANVTGMLLTLEASTSYRIEGTLMYRAAAATTGLVFAATLPSTAEATIRLHANVTQTASESHVLHIPTGGATGSAAFSATWAADPAAPTVFDADFDTICSVEGIITTGAAVGSFQLGFASEVAASAVTLRAGSVLLIERVRMETIVGTFALAGAPGFATTYTSAASRSISKPASAGLRVTLDDAGGWAIERTGTAPTGSGTPTSGSWSSPTGAGAGSQWQVLFETSAATNAYIGNDASTYQSLTSPRSCSATVYSSSSDPLSTDLITVTIKLRNAASGAVTTLAAIDFDLEAETT